MARMIPATIHSSVVSQAEKRIFREIADDPGTRDWTCLHSLGLARHASKRRGEADFVVLCQHGVFVIEVKGGRVERGEGVWRFIDRYGTAHCRSEGPFEQAAGAMFAIERELRDRIGDDRIAKAMFGYGVAIPDVEYADVGAEAAEELVYDVSDRRRPFSKYVERLARFTRERQPAPRRGLRKQDIDRIAECLRRDFDLVPALTTVLDDTVEQLTALTKEQYVVLDAIDQLPRILIDGPAGAGKTVLAMEAARRAARNGKSVLLTCYNKFLASQLSERIATEEYSGSIDVRTLHSCFRKLIGESSLEAAFQNEADVTELGELFDKVYPEYAALACLERDKAIFDVIVMDEGQDLLTMRNVTALDAAVCGGLDGGTWRIFLDPNRQASVYQRMEESALKKLRTNGAQHVLTLNCRNTRSIEFHTAVASDAERRSGARVDGLPVEFRPYDERKGWMPQVKAIVNELQKQGVSLGRVSILLPERPDHQKVRELERLGFDQLDEEGVRALSAGRGCVSAWATVSSFKGLENDLVILAGVESLGTQWWRGVVYVGMSRARSQLYVVLGEECETVRNERLETTLANLITDGEERNDEGP